MTTANLIGRFQWSEESDPRNGLTARYEPIQPLFLKVMTRHLTNVTLLDIGANIGFYAVVVGAEPTVDEVHVFEPMPEAVAAIRWNVAANLSEKSVQVHPVALSDADGDLEFAVRGPLAGDNGAWSDSVHDPSLVTITRVPCRRLDDWRIEGRNLVAEIDVEGHEWATLRGAQDTLGTNRGFLQVEMHPSPDRAEKIAYLAELGWHPVVTINSDYYFTNITQFCIDGPRNRELVEQCLAECVASAFNPPRVVLRRDVARRQIIPGVHVEVSRERADAIKKVLRWRPTQRP